MSSLKLKAARGSMVFTAISLGMRPINMLLSIILARLLSPDDFGQVGLAMLLLGMANLVSSLGMRATVIQSSADINKVSHYAFVIATGASLLVHGLVVAFAEPFASILGGGEELVAIIRWMAILITLGGLFIVPEALLHRELRFKEVGLTYIPSELISIALSIILAMAGMGVWSLVIGNLAGYFIKTIMVWFYSRPMIWLRPQKWEKAIVRDMLGFGVPNTAAAGLRYFQDNVDTWMVRSLGPVAVGLYNKAFNLTTSIGSLLTSSIFGNVLFPSYSKIKDDIPRLTRAYLKSTRMVFLMIVPISIGMAITAPILVPVLLGDQWVAMIPAWQLFSLYGLTKPVSTNSSPIFLAVGQPRRNFSASVVMLVVLLPLLFLLIEPYGIAGAAASVSVASLVAMVFNVYQMEQILPNTARKTFFQSLPFLGAGVLMALGIMLLKNPIIAISGGTNLLSLILIISLGALIYIVATLMFSRDLVIEIYELIIISLGFNKRWPRLLPKHLRTSSK